MKINCRPAERINYVRNVPRLPLPRRGKGGGELIVLRVQSKAAHGLFFIKTFPTGSAGRGMGRYVGEEG